MTFAFLIFFLPVFIDKSLTLIEETFMDFKIRIVSQPGSTLSTCSYFYKLKKKYCAYNYNWNENNSDVMCINYKCNFNAHLSQTE